MPVAQQSLPQNCLGNLKEMGRLKKLCKVKIRSKFFDLTQTEHLGVHNESVELIVDFANQFKVP